MTQMHETLRTFGAPQWGGGGNPIQIQEHDQRLCNACRNGKYEEAEQALKDGANPSVQFRLALGEITPIFLCASKGYIEIAELLINHEADINRRMDFDGTICLHHAASNDQPKMCEFLIKKGCNVNQRDKLGRTPLMDAAEIGSVQVIEVLVKANADVDLEDKERHTALSYCIDFVHKNEPKYFKAAWALVENGSNPNYAGKYASRTLLHCAALEGKLQEVKDLVEKYEATINVYDNDSKTPIDYAKDQKNTEIAEYLNRKYEEDMNRCCIIL